MKQEAAERALIIIMAIFVPCILTFFLNGTAVETDDEISKLDTGRDVLIEEEHANVLMDVEQYISGVLPGLVDYNSDISYIEAQVVAIRTKIYFTMGKATLINAKDLEYKFYTKQQYIERWGKEKYSRIKKKYNKAIINTVGKIIE